MERFSRDKTPFPPCKLRSQRKQYTVLPSLDSKRTILLLTSVLLPSHRFLSMLHLRIGCSLKKSWLDFCEQVFSRPCNFAHIYETFNLSVIKCSSVVNQGRSHFYGKQLRWLLCSVPSLIFAVDIVLSYQPITMISKVRTLFWFLTVFVSSCQRKEIAASHNDEHWGTNNASDHIFGKSLNKLTVFSYISSSSEIIQFNFTLCAKKLPHSCLIRLADRNCNLWGNKHKQEEAIITASQELWK